jgi:hypothetical protein
MILRLLLILACSVTVIKVHATVSPEDSITWNKKLEGVVVVAHRPVVKFKTDKVEYRVDNDAERNTKTVMELLRKVPMVTVDGKNKISVNGSQQFLVYIDGRPSKMISRNPSKILRNMPAGSIKKIEVITNPGAKYDAEGVGGVLNIITKKGKYGRKADFSGTSTTTIGNNRWGQDFTFGYTKDKWTVDASVMGEYEYNSNAPISSVTEYLTGNRYIETSSQNSRQRMPFGMAQVEVGYAVDSLSKIHFSLAGNMMGSRESGVTSSSYTGESFSSGISLLSDNSSKFRMGSLDGSIDYQRFFGHDNQGSMMLTYQYSYGPSRNRMTMLYKNEELANKYGFYSIRSLNNSRNINHNVMADFVLPIAQWIKFNTGAKYTAETNRSDVFSQHQDIMALYAESEIEHNWLSAKMGLRYEYTWQKSRFFDASAKNFNLHYGIFAPTASITTTINDKSSFGLNYTMRIRRPGIEELNPYIERQNPRNISYGNPHLDVEKTHSLSLLYMLNTQRFSLNSTLTHSQNNNGITQYSFIKDGVINTTFDNNVRTRQYSLNIYTVWSVTQNTRIMLNSEVGYNDFRSNKLNARNHGWTYNSNFGFQQSLPWSLKLSSNWEYMTRNYNLQGWESGMSMLSASISRSFCNDRLNITLSGTTGFGHGGDIAWRQYMVTRDFVSNQLFTMPAKTISIGISYSFGGAQKKINNDMDLELPKKKVRKR